MRKMGEGGEASWRELAEGKEGEEEPQSDRPQIEGDSEQNNTAQALQLDLSTISRYADTLHRRAKGV
jgi:hypothetical protein